MVGRRPVALLPTITEEDRAILGNVEKVGKFLTSGTSGTNKVSTVLTLPAFVFYLNLRNSSKHLVCLFTVTCSVEVESLYLVIGST